MKDLEQPKQNQFPICIPVHSFQGPNLGNVRNYYVPINLSSHNFSTDFNRQKQKVCPDMHIQTVRQFLAG